MKSDLLRARDPLLRCRVSPEDALAAVPAKHPDRRPAAIRPDFDARRERLADTLARPLRHGLY